MAKFEIERKFLVNDDSYKSLASGSHHIVQGYLSRVPERTVRIRINDDRAYITVKGKNRGTRREEYEYEIPKEDAGDMMRLCDGSIIDKIRYIVPFAGRIWEVDEFGGAHKGLTLAEVELPDENSKVDIPSFIGKEVSGDPRYYNSNL